MLHRTVIAEWSQSDMVWLVMFNDGEINAFSNTKKVLAAVQKTDRVDSKRTGRDIMTSLVWSNVPKGFEVPVPRGQKPDRTHQTL